MSSKRQNISYELPSSTTTSDDLTKKSKKNKKRSKRKEKKPNKQTKKNLSVSGDIDNEEKRFRRPLTPLDSSEAEAAPTSEREGRTPVRSQIVTRAVSRAVSSNDVSYVSEQHSWSIKYHEPSEVENSDPNQNANKHPHSLDTPPYRAPTPFQFDLNDDFSNRSPPNPDEHIILSRNETDTIINRLLCGSDGDFGDDEEFDPAIVRFGIEPEDQEPTKEAPITVYSTEDEDSDNGKSRENIVVIDDSDDEEVKIICTRETAKEICATNKRGTRRGLRSSTASGSGAVAASGTAAASVASRSGAAGIKTTTGRGRRQIPLMAKDAGTVPTGPVATSSEKSTAFGQHGPSTSSGVVKMPKPIPLPRPMPLPMPMPLTMRMSRPSTSKAALDNTIKPIEKVPIKSEPTDSTSNDDTLNAPHMTDYRFAMAEVEQLLTEDNEKNRRFFSAPSPPPADRGMFKNNEGSKRTHRESSQSDAQAEAEKEKNKKAKKSGGR